MKRKKLIISAIFLLGVGVTFIPFETMVVPSWKIRFTDDEGRPVSGVKVEESCQHYTFCETNLCSNFADAVQITDENGITHFPQRSLRLSSISRLLRGTAAYLSLAAHGSVGISAYLIVSAPMKFKSVGHIQYNPGDEPPREVVLKLE